mgnify:CR=1 FL=1
MIIELTQDEALVLMEQLHRGPHIFRAEQIDRRKSILR